MRRANHALKAINVVEDSTTGELKLPHHISLDGYYNGRQIYVEQNAVSASDNTNKN
mgnify:FL=1